MSKKHVWIGNQCCKCGLVRVAVSKLDQARTKKPWRYFIHNTYRGKRPDCK